MRIVSGARKQWIEGGQLVFVVSSSVGADRLLDAVRALERPLLLVGDEDDPGPTFMSYPATVPGGVAFWLDAPDISEARLDEVLEVIRRTLCAETVLDGGDARRLAGSPLAVTGGEGTPLYTTECTLLLWRVQTSRSMTNWSSR